MVWVSIKQRKSLYDFDNKIVFLIKTYKRKQRFFDIDHLKTRSVTRALSKLDIMQKRKNHEEIKTNF